MDQQVTNLGKQLIETFAAEPTRDVDLLSRWMAHYIEEQMTAARNATGSEKIAAEERCFRTILSLWEHRSNLPTGRRPFETFEPIFEALSRLHPDEERPYYLSSQLAEQQEEEEGETVHAFLKLAFAADIAARAVIDLLLAEATQRASSQSVHAWLQNALKPGLVSDIRTSDMHLVLELQQRAQELDLADQVSEEKRKKNVERRLEQLDAFAALCQFIRTELAKQLDKGNSFKTETSPSTELPKTTEAIDDESQQPRRKKK
jgi:hypothetical protein